MFANEGGAAGNLFSGVQAIGQSVAKSSKKKKKSTGSGASRGVNHISSGVKGIGRSVGRSARRSSGRSSGGYGRGSSQPSTPRISTPRPAIGNTPGGQIAKSVPAPPAPISVDQFLAKDTAYQSQHSAYQKALADYAAQMQAEQGKYTGEYDAQVKQLGLDRTTGLTGLKDDYASRGLLNSGVYGDALGDLNTKYDTSQADLERARQAYMDDLTTGQTNFKTTQQTMLEKARQDALNRRLDSLKV